MAKAHKNTAVVPDEDAPKPKKKAKAKAAPVTKPDAVIDIAEVREKIIDTLIADAKDRGVKISQWGAYAAALRTVWPYFIRRWNEAHRE